MKTWSNVKHMLLLLITALVLTGCCPRATLEPTNTSEPTMAPADTPTAAPAATWTPTPTATPMSAPPTLASTPVTLADTFFIGCAFLDKNANGVIDSEDAPIGGMNFIVTLSGRTGFGDLTSDEDGCATVIIPGALPREAWPVVAQMEIPQTLAYVPVGDIKITLEYPDTRADFLFSQP